jgi:predicted glycoside hydrolase/deacetylase ChbG (UPF0249 family)
VRPIRFIADDYGLSPGVDDAILRLLAAGRLSGTGCMTVFDDFATEAARLGDAAPAGAIGLHLTLTDQPALSGRSELAPDGILPRFARLAAGSATGLIPDPAIHAELDAQADRFGEAFGHEPAFVDGHQHVHFLPAVRRWLVARAPTRPDRLPWLRGAPGGGREAGAGRAKIAVVRAISARFDGAMRKAGYEVRGPLAGFYDWAQGAESFPATVAGAIGALPAGAVFMCHPGAVDDALRRRDALTDARTAEAAFLASVAFAALLDRNGAEVARP